MIIPNAYEIQQWVILRPNINDLDAYPNRILRLILSLSLSLYPFIYLPLFRLCQIIYSYFGLFELSCYFQQLNKE